MKAYNFDSKNPISRKGFLGTFKFACDCNKLHEDTAVWVLPYYVQESLTNTRNRCMCVEIWFAPLAISVQGE